jgi:hypothetical protein
VAIVVVPSAFCDEYWLAAVQTMVVLSNTVAACA